MKKTFTNPIALSSFGGIDVSPSGGWDVYSFDEPTPITLPDGTDLLVDDQGEIVE